jgi:hypothetical protein
MQIVIALFDRFTALDAVGPHQVLHQLPDTEIIFAAERERGVTDDTGTLTLQARAAFAGDEEGQRIQLALEYDPQPPYQSGSPARAKPEIVEALFTRSRFARR